MHGDAASSRCFRLRVESVLEKLRLTDRTQAVILAMRRHLADDITNVIVSLRLMLFCLIFSPNETKGRRLTVREKLGGPRNFKELRGSFLYDACVLWTRSAVSRSLATGLNVSDSRTWERGKSQALSRVSESPTLYTA